LKDKNKIQIKNKHMEESRGVYTLPVLYNEQSGRNEGVCVRSELGVVVAIDNEDEFKGVFSKDGAVDGRCAGIGGPRLAVKRPV
jgi:hypothetical protein